ncbi:hypothetical protein CS062_21105 [Roseateles chitinivorans]|uniref:Uncharacterized protein n=1 Tax=Roseateles chitinivorans TaxID=2917965 RepID=A0A2G9C6L1_9BURK|nr:hypothetical protein [Roseateles chitinivorans]PIM51179.1 hypothetical protein CS062_21105 [Roseateles chitinivorans]
MYRRRRMPRWLSLVFFGLGLFIVLLSLDVVHYVPRPGRSRALSQAPHHWWVTGYGLVLLAMSALIAFPRMPVRWRQGIGACASLTFLVSMGALIVTAPMGSTERLLFAIPLLIGGIGVLVGVRLGLSDRHLLDPDGLDPIEKARILRTHGRPEQADEVLIHAMRDQPERAPEFQRALDAMRRRRVTPDA